MRSLRIAILGWGSLLWEARTEFDQWHGKWHPGGPTLRLEFSRVSKTRLGALTLVIDEKHGTPTSVVWCHSKRTSLEDAVCDLRCREGTTSANVGRLLVPEEAAKGGAEDPMLGWARSRKLDAVIWTNLKSNFRQKTRKAFSIESVVEYVQALSPEAKAKAAEYVWRAPDFVKTPVRSVLQRESWFSEGES